MAYESADVRVPARLLDDVIALVDGLGWTAFDVWCYSEQLADRNDRLRFLAP